MAEKMSGKDVKTENLDELNFKFKVLTTKSHQIKNENGQEQCLIDQCKKLLFRIKYQCISFIDL